MTVYILEILSIILTYSYVHLHNSLILSSFLAFLVMKSASLPLTLSQDTFGLWSRSVKGLFICDGSTILPLTRVWGFRLRHQTVESFGETLECHQTEFG